MNVILVIAAIVIALALFLPLRWLLVGVLLVAVFALRVKLLAGVRTILGWLRGRPPPPPLTA